MVAGADEDVCMPSAVCAAAGVACVHRNLSSTPRAHVESESSRKSMWMAGSDSLMTSKDAQQA